MSAREKAVEVLADCEHTSWAMRQSWLHSCLVDESIPSALKERWERQIKTPYAELTEREKQSNRDEAIIALAALRAADLVIVNRADVAAAVRFAEVHSPRYNRDYEFMQHFREELGDGD